MAPNGTFALEQAPTSQVGIASGRNRYGQLATDEYISDLRGAQAVRTYYRMQGDPLVAGLLTAVKLPIIAAGWTVNPAKPADAGPNETASRQARKDADLVQNLLFEKLGYCWEDEVRQLLGFLVYGFHVAGLNWEIDAGQAVLYELRHIHPREILINVPAWFFDAKGRLAGVKQTGFAEKGTDTVLIPAESLIYLAQDAEYGRMEGRSLLRACYKPWFITEELYRFGLIGAERASVGVPLGWYPPGATQEQKTAFQEALTGLATYEQAALMMQNGPVGERYEVQNFQVEVKMDVLTPQITHHKAEMTKRFLAGFLNLGQEGAGGAYALSADQTDLFMVSLQAVADYLAARVNRTIIPKLVDYNRGPRKAYPRIGASISRTTAAAMANLIAIAAKTGLLTLGDDDEDAFREYAELPPRSAERVKEPAAVDPNADPNAPPLPADSGAGTTDPAG
jgi:hypothetical protein